MNFEGPPEKRAKRLPAQSPGEDSQLTGDTLTVVFSFLSFWERMRCRSVCRLWRRVVERITTEIPSQVQLRDRQLVLFLHMEFLEDLSRSHLARCTPESLKTLSRMTNLKRLSLPGVMLQHGGLESLSLLTRLDSLTLQSLPVGQLATCLRSLPQLTSLQLEGLHVGGIKASEQKAIVAEAFAHLTRLEKLALLNWELSAAVQAQVISSPCLRDSLQCISFRPNGLSMKKLPLLAHLSRLELTLDKANFLVPSVFGLPPGLEVMRLTLLSPLDIKGFLAHGPNLLHLSVQSDVVSNIPIFGPTFPHLRLAKLYLRNVPFHGFPEVVTRLTQLRQLEVLSGWARMIGLVPTIVDHLQNLEHLALDGSDFPLGSMEKMGQKLRQLGSLVLSNPFGNGLLELACLSTLESLAILGLVEEDFQFSALTHCRSLSIHNSRLTSQTLLEISSMESLTHLSLRGSSVAWSDLTHLGQMPCLKVLCVSGLKVSQVGDERVCLPRSCTVLETGNPDSLSLWRIPESIFVRISTAKYESFARIDSDDECQWFI